MFKKILAILTLITLLPMPVSAKSNKDKEIPFAKYKYGHRYIDELVSYNVGKDEMNNGCIVRFPKMGEIEMIDSHGICQKIKFNTREKDDIWCYKEIKF